MEKLVRVDIATVRLRSVARKTYIHTHARVFKYNMCVLWLYGGIWKNLSRERFPRLIRIHTFYNASIYIHDLHVVCVYTPETALTNIYSTRRFTCRINIHHDRGKYNI